LLGRILRNEREGVLAHLVEGWSRLQARGRFDVPESCKDALNEWLGERNPLATFIRDYVVVTGNSADVVEAQDVFDQYQSWAWREKLTMTQGRNTFYNQIASLEGVIKTKTRNGQQFLGLFLRAPESDFSDLDDVI
jgi:phage/plasmid-associated DNA primase